MSNYLTSAEPLDPSREDIAALCLGRLADGIEELMRSSNKLNKIIGLPAQYQMFFDYLDLTPIGREQIREAMAEYIDKDADS